MIDSITKLQLRWLRHNLPVLYQPSIDIQYGNQLNCIFYEFNSNNTECTIYIIYNSEASYNRLSNYSTPQYNYIGTFCYRSYNQFKYHRTSDINVIKYQNVNLQQCSYASIYTTDYSGTQCFHRLDKHNIGYYSFCYHYCITYQFNQLLQYNDSYDIKRIILYNNTCNHMISNINNNPSMLQTTYTQYDVHCGTRIDAELYCNQYVPAKWTIQRVVNPLQWRQSYPPCNMKSAIDWSSNYSL